MSYSSLILKVHENGIAELIMNKPQTHNAFDDVMINEMISALNTIDSNPKVRVLLLKANGKSFSAGADIQWMQRMANYSEQENLNDSMQLATLMSSLYHLSKPTIAVVQGASFGGGVGLVCCCDIAFSSHQASFCFSEVKIGLIPSVISPYVIKAIGRRQTHRYFLSAEKIVASKALAIGLIHELVDAQALEQASMTYAIDLLNNSPSAQLACKRLIETIDQQQIDEPLLRYTAEQIASIRVSKEGQEGLSAFLEKRNASWVKT